MTATMTNDVARGVEDTAPLELIFEGKVCDLYRARGSNGQPVAVKCLKPAFQNDVDEQARLRAEFDIMWQIYHPHVVHAISYDRERSQIVMEFVSGSSLLNRPGGRLPLEVVALIGRHLCSALMAVHARDIVHADIKPSNIMYGSDGQVTLVDFSIARPSGQALLAPNTDGSVPITAQYCSPEQALGLVLTPASDVFSLGQVLFWLLTGRKAFASDVVVIEEGKAHPNTSGDFRSAMAIASDQPQRITDWRPEAAIFAPILDGMLQHEPNDRPRLKKVARALSF
jgi:serine/threonine protein kinase